MTKKQELLNFISGISFEHQLKLNGLYNDDETLITLKISRREEEQYLEKINTEFNDNLSSIGEDSIAKPYTINFWELIIKPVEITNE